LPGMEPWMEHNTKSGTAMTFYTLLKANGFRRVKSYHKSITCMIHDSGWKYAEINKETWGQWVWAVGEGIPQASGHPGGHTYHKTNELAKHIEP
jgi:hypothetical protein